MPCSCAVIYCCKNIATLPKTIPKVHLYSVQEAWERKLNSVMKFDSTSTVRKVIVDTRLLLMCTTDTSFAMLPLISLALVKAKNPRGAATIGACLPGIPRRRQTSI